MSLAEMTAQREDEAAMNAAFVDTADRLAARVIVPRVATLDVHPFAAVETADLGASLLEAGLLGMAAPASLGGMGLGRVAVGAVLSRLAESCAGAATLVWAHESAYLALGAQTEARAGSGGTATGEGLLANGLVTPGAVRATRRADGDWRLDGVLEFVWGAGAAREILVAAMTDSGGLLAQVAVDRAGVRIVEQHDRIGLRACPSAKIELDGVAVSQAIVLSGGAFDVALKEARAGALALAGAMACGNARGALRRAVRYARERYQGGDLIIEHALVQGMLGKSLAELRAAEALVDAALAGAGDDAFLAKVVATRHGESICLDAVQVFGGYGYMRDYGVEKHLRDAKMLCLIGGSNERLLQSVVSARRHEETWP